MTLEILGQTLIIVAMFAVGMVPIAYVINKIINLIRKDDEEDKK